MFAIQTNLLVILGCAILSIIIGWLWYSDWLFGKAFMAYSGFQNKDRKKMMQKAKLAYVWSFVGTIVMVSVLSMFIRAFAISDMAGGALVGALAWLGFMMPTAAADTMWGNKKAELFYLNVSHRLVEMLIIGAILASL